MHTWALGPRRSGAFLAPRMENKDYLLKFQCSHKHYIAGVSLRRIDVRFGEDACLNPVTH